MASVTRAPDASLDADSGLRTPHVLAGDLYAGQDLSPVAPCYIAAADGRVYMSTGAAANEAAKFDGFTAKSYRAGQPVTLYGAGAMFRYSAGTLTPGQDLYVGTAAGALDTAATTGGTVPVARAINSTDIRCTRFAT